jgi:hypothetical protein|tara:strand:+ start:51 stop:755 length:705 start_codon:yes stop_codon:yes gene_type:complete
MTLDEIAYNLLNLVRGGISNQDEIISIEQIKFNIKHYRAMFIRRDFAKNNFISRHAEQDLGCVELERVNASQCCNLPVTYSVFRSVQPLPKTIRMNFKESLTYIGDVTGTRAIPLVDSHTIQFLPYDKYTKGKYKAYMIADYLYIYNADGLDTINVRGIFEDPAEVSKYALCDKGNCYESNKDPFPISMDMINLINQGITSGELNLLTGTFSDTSNDRMQDPPGRSANPKQQQQ